MHCRIGTRGSRLALAQAELVKRRLEAAYGEDSFELVILSSRGDRDRVSPLAELGAGAFVRDLEERLLAGEVVLGNEFLLLFLIFDSLQCFCLQYTYCPTRAHHGNLCIRPSVAHIAA